MAATHSRTDCPEYSVTPFRGLMRTILGRVSNSTCGSETPTLMDSGLAAVVIFSVRGGACRHGIGVSGCELVNLSGGRFKYTAHQQVSIRGYSLFVWGRAPSGDPLLHCFDQLVYLCRDAGHSRLVAKELGGTQGQLTRCGRVSR